MADAHTNITLTDAWALLVTAGDDFTLTLPRLPGPVELVPMATETAPDDDLIGHVLSPSIREAFNRALSGPGYIYGRATQGDTLIALSAWTPA
jgi:hypothetical protein